MISTSMDKPEDAKDQLFMNGLLFAILLLLILSLWPLEYASFLSGLSLSVMLLPGGRRFRILKGLRRKLMLRKKEKGKMVSALKL